jgi:glycosyltransferase involved in cell wall biosynthesis
MVDEARAVPDPTSQQGWLPGLAPRDALDGEFLKPYYEASGWNGPPAETWLELSALSGWRAPRNRGEAEPLARRLVASGLFDADAYAKRLGDRLDAALHYAVIGEILGWRPSRGFDPLFYRERHREVADAAASPLDHYLQHGANEGRRATPVAERLAFPALADPGRPAVLVLLHDATRSGAPVLGWNIVRRLAATYSVVSVLMGPGELEPHFVAASAAVIGPLAWEDMHVAEMSRLAERLATTYAPLYAVANSIETHALVPALAKVGVPAVALVHEFPSYTRPLGKVRDVVDWAGHVIFPAQLVASSAYAAFPAVARRRGIHVRPQGVSVLPKSDRTPPETAMGRHALAGSVRPAGDANLFVVLGIGHVQFRKGLDMFLATAALLRRRESARRFRFVWIGNGYDPAGDHDYAAYLAEQIARSGLEAAVAILGAIEDLDAAYDEADIFFLASRLDPQPNVGIDAVTRGIPTVCFEGASGTAEVLLADPDTRSLVVPHLDVCAAADVIERLARDPADYARMRAATARVGGAAYDMASYIRLIEQCGRSAAAALHAEDLQTLAQARVVDAELALPPGEVARGAFGAERFVLHQWAVVGTSRDQAANLQFRRPCAGFHPQRYAAAHHEACGEGGANPVAHWVRAGRPEGPWIRQVFSPLDLFPSPSASPRVALHAQFRSIRSARDFATRLARNDSACDLFLSTDSKAQAADLRSVFAGHRGTVAVTVVPGSSTGHVSALIAGADRAATGEYDLIGHFHDDPSVKVDGIVVENCRTFLWDNLIGGEYRMLDLAMTAFATQPELGLLIAEDPHLAGWNEARAAAEALAGPLGIPLPLDEFFDFPLGGMFWCRTGALQPLAAAWRAGSVAGDHTRMDTLERLLPFVVRRAGFSLAGMRAPFTTY